jgi:hypothetical protein
MVTVFISLIVLLNLAFGVAGLFWPDRLMRFFTLFMFPWPATHRAIRFNAAIAIAGYVLLMAHLFVGGR